jgi:hypothetical protein
MEPPLQSWPLHFERKYFLGADVSGDHRRVIRREPEPLADRACSPAPHLTDIRNGPETVVPETVGNHVDPFLSSPRAPGLLRKGDRPRKPTGDTRQGELTFDG